VTPPRVPEIQPEERQEENYVPGVGGGVAVRIPTNGVGSFPVTQI
jgi:hypothetical protein